MTESHIFGKSQLVNQGEGPGDQTRDGCSVALYTRLPVDNEPEIISTYLPRGSSILEMGCGVGRVTHPLIRLGYAVTAVDNSKEMLAHILGAETILADIETLRLSARFDGVLMGSHLINVPNPDLRADFLSSCAHHLAGEGVLFLQCHDPASFQQIEVGFLGERDGLKAYCDRAIWDGDTAEMTLRWEIGEDHWTQSFQTEMLSQDQIGQALAKSGLVVKEFIDSHWMLAAKSPKKNETLYFL
ncbi:MAG: class I SAM-dependent methyltransferase [Chloroflexota bacterium]